jgi:hypothetical protein
MRLLGLRRVITIQTSGVAVRAPVFAAFVFAVFAVFAIAIAVFIVVVDEVKHVPVTPHVAPVIERAAAIVRDDDREGFHGRRSRIGCGGNRHLHL